MPEKQTPHSSPPFPKQVLQFSIPDSDSPQQKQRDCNVRISSQSEEYITPSLLKAMEKQPSRNEFYKQSKPLFCTFKQDSHTPVQYSQESNITAQRKSKTIIKSKKERNFVGLKPQKLPPYLENIIRRKQTFKNFMVAHSKKSYEQLIQQQLDDIKANKNSQSVNNIVQKPICKQLVIVASPVSPLLNKSSSMDSNYFIQPLITPTKPPDTPSFVPVSEPLTPLPYNLKITDMLKQQLKAYQMDDDDLSLELFQ